MDRHDFIRETITVARQIKLVRKEYGTQVFEFKDEHYRVERQTGFMGLAVSKITIDGEVLIKRIKARSFMAALLKVLVGFDPDENPMERAKR